MSKKEDLDILYNNPVPKIVRNWEQIYAPCRILDLLTIYDISYLNSIAKSVKLSSEPSKKKKMITELMEARGFKRLDCGTNRIVYKYMENQSFLIKVAFDRVALQDNLNEMRNQEYLKPFCAKCFEVSPCGTVGLFERVQPVLNREQFASIAPRVFDIIVNCFIGKYVLADFGSRYYKNWGVRKGAHPVILDYPYLYELDPAKLSCDRYDPTSPTGHCGGEIDYDDGFNYLVCSKCGKTYLASELAKKTETNKTGLMVEREEIDMKIQLTMRDGSVRNINSNSETSTYKKKETRGEYRTRKNLEQLKVHIQIGDHSEIKAKEAEEAKKLEEQKKHEEEMNRVKEPELFKPMAETEKPIKVVIEGRNGKTYETKEKNGYPYNYYANSNPTANLYGTGASEYVEEEPDKPEEYPLADEVKEKLKQFDTSNVSETVEAEDIVEASPNDEDTKNEKAIDVSALQNTMMSNSIKENAHENRSYSSYSSEESPNDENDTLIDEY